MLIPGPVLIIPIYLLLARLDLVGTYPGLILVYLATGLPFAVFFLTLSFRGIPDEVHRGGSHRRGGLLPHHVVDRAADGIERARDAGGAAVPRRLERADLRVHPHPG